MGGMTAVFVVGAIAVVGAVVARVTWRRPADERHSIQSHQQTLDTLRSMADRRPPSQRDKMSADGSDATSAPPGRTSRARSGPAHAAPVGSAPTRPAPVRPARAAAPGGHGADDLVFVDDPSPTGAGDFLRPSPISLPGGLGRPGRGHRRQGGSRGRSTPRLLPLAAAAVVLAAVIGAAVALSPSHSPKTNSALHRPSTKSKSSSTTVAQTTMPPPAQVHASSSTATTADYGAPATGYTVALRATGPCWVEATAASTGDVVWTGTMTPGQTRSVPATGSLILRLGAPENVSVTLNGSPVVLPSGYQSPFDMKFTSA